MRFFVGKFSSTLSTTVSCPKKLESGRGRCGAREGRQERKVTEKLLREFHSEGLLEEEEGER